MLKASDLMTKEFVKLRKDAKLSEAIGQLRESNIRAAAVYDKKKFVGAISRTAMLKSDAHPTKSTLVKFIRSPPKVKITDDIVKVAELMYQNYPIIIPVLKGKKVDGFIRDIDLVQALKQHNVLLRLKLSEVMTPNPATFRHTDRLGNAVNLMREKHIGRIPVIDESGKLVSVLSFNDIMQKVLSVEREKQQGTMDRGKGHTPESTKLLDTNIGDEATLIKTTLFASNTVSDAIREMEKFELSDIVIVDSERKPIGIVTTRDLLELYLRLKEQELSPVRVVGIEHLKPMQLSEIKNLAEGELAKYEKFFPAITYFIIHVKPYEEGERSRTKWSVHLRLAAPGEFFIKSEAHYDLNTAVSWALKSLTTEIKRKKEKKSRGLRQRGLGRRKAYEDYQLHKQREDKWKVRQARLE